MPIKQNDDPRKRFELIYNQKIWKYYDVYKFLYLIERSVIHFAYLKDFEDPLEGLLTEATIRSWKMQATTEKEKVDVENSISFIKDRKKEGLIAVSSWCRNEWESYYLWKNYGNGKYSICLQSTIGKLLESAKETTEDINIEEVRYFDFKNYINNPITNFIDLATIKNIHYQDEREIRLLVFNPTIIDIQVNLSILIDKIILSPLMEPWEKDVVKSLLKICSLNKNYSLDKYVVDSEIQLK
ncbi:MAG: hypothetical protein HPY53_10315 [Brevinematales bacterium]|nr:hypothetical protein [Brevinematales bacterium]